MSAEKMTKIAETREPAVSAKEPVDTSVAEARSVRSGRKSPNVAPLPEQSNNVPISRPLLTICVPTYKRGKHSTALATSIISNILNNSRYNVELIIVNNCSPDDTQIRLAKISHPRFKLVNREEHLDTAEENIIRSLPFATGEYVWFLGDDDVIYLNNFESHYAMLESGKFDLLIFNSSLISPTGKVVRQQSMKMNASLLTMPLDQLVESIGLLFTFAGVSNVIQRTSKLTVENGLEWLRTSKIYSHVAWIIDQHRDSKVALVNSPLVFYRQNDYSDGHWERVAEKQRVPNLYFWSLGLVRLLDRLIEKGAFTYRQAGSIFEQAIDGSRYRLIDDMIFKTFQQIELGAVSKLTRQILTNEEFDEIANFILKCDPMTFDILDALADGQQAILAVNHYGDVAEKVLEKLRSDFMSLYVDRQAAGQFFSRFAAKLMGFDVYQMPGTFIAIQEANIALREEVLRVVDPLEQGGQVVLAPSMDEIEARIRDVWAAKLAGGHTPLTEPNVAPSINVQVDTTPLMAMTQLLHDQVRANHDLLATINAIQSSTSWQMTLPMRKVIRMFRRRA